MTTNLDLIRKAVRQQTNFIDQPVRNLLGPVATSIIGLTTEQISSWLVLSLPGSRLLSDTEFYVLYATDPLKAFQEIQAVNGAVDLSIAPGHIILLRSVLDLPGDTRIQTTMSTGSAQSEFAIYVGGTLMYKGSGKRSFGLQLAAGKHAIDIVVASSNFQMQFPSNLAFSTLQDVVNIPIWFDITPGYTDPVSGNTGNLLEWYNDVRVGGWDVYRKETTSLGLIVGLGTTPDNNGDFAVVIDGDYSAELRPGVSVFSGLEEMGIIMDAVYDSAATITYNGTLYTGLTQCRVRLVSTRTTINTFWTGRNSGIALVQSIQHVVRSGSGTLVSVTDGTVISGNVYEYALQAFGIFNPGLLSPWSPWFFTRAGDITPPGVIIFEPLHPRVLNGRVTVQYTTPADQDYKGVRVLERILLQTGTSAGETSVSVTSSSQANPSVIVTATHGLTTGDAIFISGHVTAVPDINGGHIVTVIDSTSFSIPVNVTTGGTGGSFVPNDTFILSAAPTADPTGYSIEITSGTGDGQVRIVETGSIASAAVTISSDLPWAIAPDNTSTYDLYLDTVKLSDIGVPNQKDQLTWDATRNLGTSNIAERTDGSGTQGTPDTFSSATGGFTAGVFVGNLLEIRSSPSPEDQAFYTIDVIQSDTVLEISPVPSGTPLQNDDTGITFEIFGNPGDPAYGDYHFVTFDHVGNQQAVTDGVLWTYTSADDTITGGGNQAPKVSIRQLNVVEQLGLATQIAGLTTTGPPTTVTANGNHGLRQGDIVTISGQTGTTQAINQRWYVLSVPTATTFTILANVTSDSSNNDGTISPPYVDTVKYAVVEVSADDPEDGTVGVLINYRDRTREVGDADAASTSSTLVDATKTWNLSFTNQWRNYLVEIISGPAVGQTRLISSNTATVLTITPDWNTIPGTSDVYLIHWVQVSAETTNLHVDDPRGIRGRYVAVSRKQNENWFQVQAEDSLGALSNRFTYTPDFDSLPELAFTVIIDPVLDEAIILGTLDDDANSFEWWVSAPAGATIRAGDPVVNNKRQFTAIELGGVKTFGNVTATEMRLGIPDGEARVVHLQPSTGTRVPVSIAISSIADPTTITTDTNHGLIDQETVTISGHSGHTSTPDVNGSHVVTVTGPTTFTIPVDVTVGGTGGSVSAPTSILGIEYTRTLTRTPRTIVTTFNRDEAGNVSAKRVQVNFSTRPTVVTDPTTPPTPIKVDESLRITQRTDGVTVQGGTVKTISGNTAANPTVVTTTTAHNLSTGDPVLISGTNSLPGINGSRIATFISSTTFSVPVNVATAGTTGTAINPDSVSSSIGGFTGVVVGTDFLDLRNSPTAADEELYQVTGVHSDTILGIAPLLGGSALIADEPGCTFAVMSSTSILDDDDLWAAGDFDYDPVLYNTYYAVWEPSDGTPFQIRKILTNLDGVLNVNPAWTPTNVAGAHVIRGLNFPVLDDVYRIKHGAALYSLGMVLPTDIDTFTPVIERVSGGIPQIFLDRDPVDIIISYYSEIVGSEAEKIQEYTIDNDSLPELGGIDAFEDPANILTINITGIDDDVKLWKCYAKKSTNGIGIDSCTVANPTVITTGSAHGLTAGDVVGISGEFATTDAVPAINGEYIVGTVADTTHFEIPVNVTVGGAGGGMFVSPIAWPTVDDTRFGPLDPTYLRFQGTVDEPAFNMQAGDGEWYVIGVPVGSFNDIGLLVFPENPASDDSQSGADKFTPVNVIGTASSTPTLTNLLVTGVTSGAERYHHFTWNHNSNFDSDDNYQIKIFGYRLDEGIFSERELTGTGDEYYTGSPNQVGTRRVYSDIDLPVPDQNLANDDPSDVSAAGSFQHLAGPAGSVISLTWKYRIEVWDDPETMKIREYTSDKTENYALPAPSGLYVSGLEIIPYGNKDYVHQTFSWTLGDSGATTEFWEKKDANDLNQAFLIKTLAPGVTSHTVVHLKDQWPSGPPQHDYYNWLRHKSGANFSVYVGNGNSPPATSGFWVDYSGLF